MTLILNTVQLFKAKIMEQTVSSTDDPKKSNSMIVLFK